MTTIRREWPYLLVTACLMAFAVVMLVVTSGGPDPAADLADQLRRERR